jgi:hypothetical protein
VDSEGLRASLGGDVFFGISFFVFAKTFLAIYDVRNLPIVFFIVHGKHRTACKRFGASLVVILEPATTVHLF